LGIEVFSLATLEAGRIGGGEVFFMTFGSTRVEATDIVGVRELLKVDGPSKA
jgi:hypothetical protein